MATHPYYEKSIPHILPIGQSNYATPMTTKPISLQKAKHSVEALERAIKTHQCFLMALGECDVKWVQQLK